MSDFPEGAEGPWQKGRRGSCGPDGTAQQLREPGLSFLIGTMGRSDEVTFLPPQTFKPCHRQYSGEAVSTLGHSGGSREGQPQKGAVTEADEVFFPLSSSSLRMLAFCLVFRFSVLPLSIKWILNPCELV